MADPYQSAGPPGGPAGLPPWPPLAHPPLQAHQQQHLMITPTPPFSPFPPGHYADPGFHGNPGFVHGFSPQHHQHYYDVAPRSFPFHGLPPNQGTFGSPPLPLLPPPPQRAPPQMVSGMFSSIESPGGGAGHIRSGNVVHLVQYNRTPPLGISGSDNLGFSKEDEGISVIEKAIQETQMESKVDVPELLSQIRALVVQAEEAVTKVGKLVMMEPSISEPLLVTCPYNPTHRVSPEVLFKHFLCCSSNPKPQVDAQKLISSLQYPLWQDHNDDSEPGNDDHKCVDLQNLILDDGRNPRPMASCSDNFTKGEVQMEKGKGKDQIPILGLGIGDVTKASVGNEIDIWGGRFFYKDSPAVFQAPLPTPYPGIEMSENQLALTYSVDQLGAKLESVSVTKSIPSMGGIASPRGVCGDSVGPLLPSRFWFLVREIETWKELPTRCSNVVLQTATGVGRVRRKVVSDWALVHGPAHGVVIDPAVASHIRSLAKICLKSLQREASSLIDHHCGILEKRDIPPSSEIDTFHTPKSDFTGRCGTDDEKKLHGNGASCLTKVKEEPPSVIGDVRRSLEVSLLGCPHLFQSGHWLTSQLSSLFGPSQSKLFVLNLLKHCLVISGRILASYFIEALKKQATEGRVQLCRSLPNQGGDVKPPNELQTPEDVRQMNSEPVKSKDGTLAESALPLELETAIAALRERAVLESYLKSLTYPSLAAKFQMTQEHEATVMMAAAERRTRVNYRPVLEHDGLIWHRSQLEEKNKNKTKEEILAEERDYKRRRMSYRGKKLKRNPTEVMHDLIGGHMEEIVDAGGIGCFVKHTEGVAPIAKAGVDSCQTSNLSNMDDLIKQSLYDDQPRPLTSLPMNLNAMDDTGSWNGHSKGRPGRRDDRSNEQIRSRTAEHDFNYAGTGSQDNRCSDGVTHDDGKEGKYKSYGSRWKFHRHNSQHSSDSGKGNQRFHYRSEGDNLSDSRSYGVDNSVDQSTKDYRRGRSCSQRYSESREGSNEDDGYERRHSREYMGKSKSIH